MSGKYIRYIVFAVLVSRHIRHSSSPLKKDKSLTVYQGHRDSTLYCLLRVT